MKILALQKLENKIQLRLSRIFNRSFCPPYEVLITLTNRCNLQCIMCSFRNYSMDIADELKTKNIIDMIDEIVDLGVKNIVFSGGEPFLRNDLLEIIHHATKKGIKNSTILTNGTITNEDIIEKINSSGLKSICISIDGLENNHDYIRGRGTFKKSMHFVEQVRKRCPQVYLNVTSVIMNFNLEDIPGLLELCEEMGIKQISFQPIISDNTDWTNKLTKDDLWIPEHRLPLLDAIIDKIISFKKKNDIIGNDYFFLELIKSYFRKNIQKMERMLNCYEGFRRFTITAGGHIWICGTEMKMNIVKNGLKRCWQSSEVRKKRETMMKCKQLCLQACAFEVENDSIFLLIKRWLEMHNGNKIK